MLRNTCWLFAICQVLFKLSASACYITNVCISVVDGQGRCLSKWFPLQELVVPFQILMDITFLTSLHLDPLTEANFSEEVAAFIPSQWRVVGISLHISTEVLDSFERKHDSDLRCFGEVFRAWKANNSPLAPFTWSGVVQALHRNFVGESRLAGQLMQAHFIPEGITVTHFQPHSFLLSLSNGKCSHSTQLGMQPSLMCVHGEISRRPSKLHWN